MSGNNRRRGKGYTPKPKGSPANYRAKDRQRDVARMPKRDGEFSPLGAFEAESRKRDGTRYVTRHHTYTLAAKRLAGNRRHTAHRITDLTPR